MSADGPIFGKFRVTRTDGNEGPGTKHDGCLNLIVVPAQQAFMHALGQLGAS